MCIQYITFYIITCDKKNPDLYFCFFWSGDNWDRAPLNMTVICLHPFLSLHLPHFLKTLTRQLKHGFSQITFTQRLMRHNQFLSLQCPGGQWQKDIRICCRQAAIEPASHCQLHCFFSFPKETRWVSSAKRNYSLGKSEVLREDLASSCSFIACSLPEFGFIT